MNPFTWLYRRSRTFRVLCSLLVVLATFVMWAIADDQFAHDSQVGDLAALVGFMVFAAWAWWYGDGR